MNDPIDCITRKYKISQDWNTRQAVTFYSVLWYPCIIKTTRKRKSKFGFSHDEISSKILKHFINIIAVPITHIINRSLPTGLVPGKLKLAKVIPIFKSADSSQIKHYHPICLLPVFSKLLEKNNV